MRFLFIAKHCESKQNEAKKLKKKLHRLNEMQAAGKEKLHTQKAFNEIDTHVC